MAIQDNGTENEYTVTGAQTVFPYTFEIFTKNDIAVQKNGVLLSEGTDYTVSGVGVDAGGNVTFTVAAALGDIVKLYRDMALERLTDYQAGGEFLSATVNNDFDRLWSALQQNKTAIDNTLTTTTESQSTTTTKQLAAGQLVIPLLVEAASGVFFISDGDTDGLSRRLTLTTDYTVTGTNEITLIKSFPENSYFTEQGIPNGAAKREDAGTTYTVGTGGTFADLNTAIAFLIDRVPVTPNATEATPVTLNLLTGFVMAEQVILNGVNLGWVEITSDDAEVTIARSALLKSIGSEDTSRPAFGGVSSTMPIINALFTMDTSGTPLGREDGLFVENGKATVRTGAGFKNCTEVGIYANSGSQIQAEGAICTGCTVYGFFAFKGSSINCQSAVADNCGQYGLYVNRASQASANSAQFNNAGVNAIRVIRGSICSWEDGVGTGATEAGMYVLSSTVQALRADVSGATEEGIYAHDCSQVGFRDGNANTCAGVASIWAFRGSSIDADGATATASTSTTAAVLAQRGSIINFQDGDINTSSSPNGVRASEGSTINAKDANCQLGGATSTADGDVFAGGTLVYTGATGGVGQTINTLTADGIIYQ